MGNKKTKDSAILQNRIHSNNYNEQSVPKNTGFDKLSFVFKIIRIRDSQQKEKEKKEDVRNDDKKVKQIRIFLYQLYPIKKLKIIKCKKN